MDTGFVTVNELIQEVFDVEHVKISITPKDGCPDERYLGINHYPFTEAFVTNFDDNGKISAEDAVSLIDRITPCIALNKYVNITISAIDDTFGEIDITNDDEEEMKKFDLISVEEFIKEVWEVEHIKISLTPVDESVEDIEKVRIMHYPFTESFDGNKTVDEFLNERIRPCIPIDLVTASYNDNNGTTITIF